jgi:hypothetical protein
MVEAVTNPNATTFPDECNSLCPVACESWNYKIDEKKPTYVPGHFLDNLSRGNVQSASLKLYLNSKRLKVVDEQLIFGLNELIGHVGGTWGFYLGMSLVRLVHFLNDLIRRFF